MVVTIAGRMLARRAASALSASASSPASASAPEAWASSSVRASWTAFEDTVTPETASTACFSTIWSAQAERCSSVSRSLAPSEATAAFVIAPFSTVISTSMVLKSVVFWMV